MELIIPLNDDDLELMPYYAKLIGVPMEALAGLDPQAQVNLLSSTMYTNLRNDAVGLKAKEAGLAARQAIIEQYKPIEETPQDEHPTTEDQPTGEVDSGPEINGV